MEAHDTTAWLPEHLERIMSNERPREGAAGHRMTRHRRWRRYPVPPTVRFSTLSVG
jgi:hypothetical protein